MPPNTRLQTLLDRCPLGEEDCHNITVIFHALSPEKQQFILDNWDVYIVEMVMARKEIDANNRAILDRVLELADTLKDAKNHHEAEKEIERFQRHKQVRLELDSIQGYQQSKKLNLLRSLGQIPDE
jgi:predicted nucleotidyltransferase component of viral defense system